MDSGAEGRGSAPNFLWRRYSEFELLRSYLVVTYPHIVVPPLPEKRVSSDPKSRSAIFTFSFCWIFVHRISQLRMFPNPNL